MTGGEIATAVSDTLSVDRSEFETRVAEEAEFIKRHVEAGTFDNSQAIVGLEFEFYAVAAGTARLVRMPRPLLGLLGFEKELGLHNAETQTAPQPLNAYGLESQRRELQSRLRAAQRRAAVDDIRLVSDGLWTTPPAGESSVEYLTDAVVADGQTIGTNLSDRVRYQSFANSSVEIGCQVDVPGATLSAPIPGPASLTCTIQPHLQIPRASALPAYHAYALRIAGPLLALGVNSPFLPPELYDAPADEVLAEGWHEHRIPVFEDALNPVDEPDKVRFPEDVDSTAEAIDRIAADPTIVPATYDVDSRQSRRRFDDAVPHFQHKHGSYWRWVRPVFDGADEATANARIEFRPLPAQPTVLDAVAFQALFGGLLVGLVTTDHPLADQDWETARENFDAAVQHGIDADLTWITAAGEETTDPDRIFGEVIEHAREGLRRRGLDGDEIEAYLAPIRERIDREITPAAWKRARVREFLADGDGLTEAIHRMQDAYVDRQTETLLEGSFVDWLDE